MAAKFQQQRPDSAQNSVNHPILVLNSGSSSLRFALYQSAGPIEAVASGRIERIRLSNPTFSANVRGQKGPEKKRISIGDHKAALQTALHWLVESGFKAIAATGHRIVHGGPLYRESARITPKMIKELRRLSPYDPEHMPGAIRLIELIEQRYPGLPQVACFDTAFHREMPRVAKLLPIPRRFDAQGVQRYGFHGLSYSYIMEELGRLEGRGATLGRLILAHLGNGASLAAVRQGKSIDTTMAFTPAAGIPMSTRSGDLDPGLVGYFARTEGMTPAQFHRMVNRESGLLGVSEISSDMRDLTARSEKDVRAREAIDLFCYQVKKAVGSFAAALGGVDMLVFAGGIGEHTARVRAGVCEGLGFLGIALDKRRNEANKPIISTDSSAVKIRIIRTDEEQIIAREVLRILKG